MTSKSILFLFLLGAIAEGSSGMKAVPRTVSFADVLNDLNEDQENAPNKKAKTESTLDSEKNRCEDRCR